MGNIAHITITSFKMMSCGVLCLSNLGTLILIEIRFKAIGFKIMRFIFGSVQMHYIFLIQLV